MVQRTVRNSPRHRMILSVTSIDIELEIYESYLSRLPPGLLYHPCGGRVTRGREEDGDGRRNPERRNAHFLITGRPHPLQVTIAK